MERPILFSGPMVRAILEGRKCKTRRPVHPLLHLIMDGDEDTGRVVEQSDEEFGARATEHATCPYGRPGDRLWVKETFRHVDGLRTFPRGAPLQYRADWEREKIFAWRWRPSIYLPRWASRIDLVVTGVHVERLQALTHKGAREEGVQSGRIPATGDHPELLGYVLGDDDGKCTLYPTPQRAFEVGWDALNAQRGFPWSSNPWVWVVQFQVLRPVARKEAS